MAANRVFVLQRHLLAGDVSIRGVVEVRATSSSNDVQHKWNGGGMQVRATSTSEDLDSDGIHTGSGMNGVEDFGFAEGLVTDLIKPSANFKVRLVAPGDGKHMWHLCKEVGMDENSPYLYNLFCIDYADTCLIAFDGKTGSAVGYILGYIPPARPDAYFVWQIGASKATQGSGLARHLLDRAVAHCGVTHVEASVTPSNIASNKFFQKLAKNRGAAWTLDDQWMPAEDFPKVSASHEREALYRIGPLAEGVVPRLFRLPAIFAHGSMPRASALPCVLNLGTRKGTLKPSSKLAQEQVFGERRNFQIRLVVPGDGANMWQLCKEVGMDKNSPYLYNLFCIDYADTCLIAIDEKSESVVGYMLGYIPPTRQDTYFVWQIGALPNLQGSGLVQHLLDRAVAHCGVTHVEASVTPSNIASNKFFQKFAKYHGAAWTLDEQWMPAEDFPKVSMSHEREALYRIGPFGIDRPSL